MTAAKQERLVNGSVATTLNGAITNSALSLVVTSSSGFSSDGNFRIRIDDEIILVTAVSGTTWTIVRGTGVAHSNGAAVIFYLTADTFPGMQWDMYQVGLFADRPTTAKTGAIYVPTDGMVICRYNGSVWEEWGELHNIVPPATNFDAGYSWVNQGSASLTHRGLSWIFKIPAETGGSIRFMKKAVPTAPYTIEMGLRFLVAPVNYVNLGFIWYDGTKIINAGFNYDSARGFAEFVGKYTNTTTFNSAYTGGGNIPHYAQLNYPQYLRFCDDNVNRFVQVSQNKRDWLLIPNSVISRTNFLTATHIGFGGGSSNNFDCFMEIFHYREF